MELKLDDIFPDEAMLKLAEGVKIDDTFLDEHVFAASYDLIHWFSDF